MHKLTPAQRAAALLICIFGASQALAAGYNFLKQTPLGHFSKADMQVFTTTLNQALDELPDGGTANWSGNKTGSSGSIRISEDAEKRPGCRVANIANAYKTLKSEGQYLFCKKDGTWKMIPG